MSFAIITPSYNKARYVRACLDSIHTQEDVEVDHWVLDNCSTDGTVEILREELARNPGRFKLLVEPDTGQASAINKGFSLANGEILGWLNADDIYLPQTLRKVERYFREHPEVDLLYGKMRIVDEDRKLIHLHTAHRPDLRQLKKQDFIPQPTSFWRRRVWEQIGPLDESLHWGLDWDFYIRTFQKFQVAFLDDELAEAVYDKDMKTRTGGATRVRELQAVARRHDGWMNPTNLYCTYYLFLDRLIQPLLRQKTIGPMLSRAIEKFHRYTIIALYHLRFRSSV
jgi:glycosyltransferase involved in cell wall biosynthesis